MAHFDKTSPEYIGNGHYKINDIDYMSVWAFKKMHSIQPNNASSNGTEGQELISKCNDIHSSSPDFGGYSKIYLYPIAELEDYYGV